MSTRGFASDRPIDPCALTPRELEVETLYAAGLARRHIAARLGITPGSVDRARQIGQDKRDAAG